MVQGWKGDVKNREIKSTFRLDLDGSPLIPNAFNNKRFFNTGSVAPAATELMSLGPLLSLADMSVSTRASSDGCTLEVSPGRPRRSASSLHGKGGAVCGASTAFLISAGTRTVGCLTGSLSGACHCTGEGCPAVSDKVVAAAVVVAGARVKVAMSTAAPSEGPRACKQVCQI
jgi:hypothetical protein